MHLLQYHDDSGSHVGVLSDGSVRRLRTWTSFMSMALDAVSRNLTIDELAASDDSGPTFLVDDLDDEQLTPISHPDFASCTVSGTGLTHVGSARERESMHSLEGSSVLTDSARLFKLGQEGGRPAQGTIGSLPEWFYKGDGSIVRGPGEEVVGPAYGCDVGDEAELAGVYVIDAKGRPFRIGFALGNEFSDHVVERQNYLYLAHSKLRQCALGAEIITGSLPHSIEGRVTVARDGEPLAEVRFLTGEANMCHSIANLEHHHFKYSLHRRPGSLHIHFFGADGLTTTAGVSLGDGDVVTVRADAFELPLSNTIRHDPLPEEIVNVEVL